MQPKPWSATRLVSESPLGDGIVSFSALPRLGFFQRERHLPTICSSTIALIVLFIEAELGLCRYNAVLMGSL